MEMHNFVLTANTKTFSFILFFSLISFTLQLCITINNIEQVRRSLKPLPTLLDFNEIQQAVELARDDPLHHSHKKGGSSNSQAPGDAAVGLLGTASLQGIIKLADESMVNKIRQVVDRVADKVSLIVGSENNSEAPCMNLITQPKTKRHKILLQFGEQFA